jgi:hypothetical protein
MSMSGSRATTPEESAEHDREFEKERAEIEARRTGVAIDTSEVKTPVKNAANSKSDNSPKPPA